MPFLSIVVQGQNPVTVVVGQDGEGDATTIADGLALLPAEGGKIALREGTYSISSTITLPNKPVVIEGMGARATKVSLGANAIAAFTVPAGAAATQDYVFIDFEIEGTGVAGQKAVNYAGASTAEVFFERMEIDNVDTAFDVASGGVFLSDTISNVKKIFNNQGGALFRVEHCIISFTENAALVVNPATSCNFEHTSFNVSGITFFEMKFNSAKIEMCSFVGVKMSVAAANSAIAFCRIRGDGTNTPLTVLSSAARFACMGCEFENAPTGIDIQAGEGTYVGNIFQNQTTPILESGAANNNVISSNRVSNGNFFTLIGSVTTWDGGNVQSFAADVTLTENHRTVLVDATGAARTVNLPLAASAKGRIFVVKKEDASINAVTIDPSGAETIDGAATHILATQNASAVIQSNGTKWIILAENL